MIYMHSKYDNMHKNEIFYALISINNDIIACYQCPCKLCENSLLSSLYLMVKSFEEEIQLSEDRVDTVRG